MIQQSRLRRVFGGVLGAIILGCACGLAACAPQANDSSTDASENKAANLQVEFTWSEKSDCVMCHSVESASFKNEACGASQHVDVACLSCHADTSMLAVAHVEATVEQAKRATLKSTSVSSDACESCHVLADVAQATAGATVLTDSNGTVANPHMLPESEDHAELTCTSCHQMHVVDADIEKKAQRACASCHHAGVYECRTCHS